MGARPCAINRGADPPLDFADVFSGLRADWSSATGGLLTDV